MKPDREVIAIDELELRLRGTDVPDGQIALSRLAELARALQGVATRLGRDLVGQQGPGRSPAAVERAAELRLRGLSEGSTRLAIAVGEEEVLATEGLEHRVTGELFDIFTGIAENRPPEWTTPAIGEAAVALINALAHASRDCEVSRRDRTVQFAPRESRREVWPVAPVGPHERSGVTVSGRLEVVDLRRSRFRVRDRAGNDIVLEHVINATDVAHLAGGLVTATGTATLTARGRISGLSDAVVQATSLPDWSPPSLADALAGATPPPEGGIDGVDEDELGEFLALIRQ